MPVGFVEPDHPCDVYRKYFAGNPDFSEVISPSDAERHLCACRHGCDDFFHAITMVFMPGEGISHHVKVRVTSVQPANPRQQCRTPLELRAASPDEGTVALHVLICDGCRNETLRQVATKLRAKYRASAPVQRKN